MGYYVKSKRLNVILNQEQQEKIFNIWMNPPEIAGDIGKDISLKIVSHYFKEEKCSNIKDVLDIIGFTYEEKKKGLKLKSHEAKWRHQHPIFDVVSEFITPGSSMTFRGEDGAFIGWFFNGKGITEYESYDELKKLEDPFNFKKTLDKELPIQNTNNKLKIKL